MNRKPTGSTRKPTSRATVSKPKTESPIDTAKVVVISKLPAGQTLIADGRGSTFVPIEGIQIVDNQSVLKGLEVAGIGTCMTASDYLGQPIALIKSQASTGITVEAASYLRDHAKAAPAVSSYMSELLGGDNA